MLDLSACVVAAVVAGASAAATAQALAKFQASESAKWAKVITAAGIEPE